MIPTSIYRFVLVLAVLASAAQGQSGCPGCPAYCEYSPGTYLNNTPTICYVVTGPVDVCTYPMGNGCNDGENMGNGCCATCYTPLIVDLNGDGIRLTGPTDGILIKPRPDLPPVRFSWPRAASQDAWLALDRNGNGRIDDLTELFGNYAPQPNIPGQMRNGFSALAEFDKPENGGNADGWISSQDQIWQTLLLWHDGNFDGQSSPEELIPIAQSDILSISLDFKDSRVSDEHGNLFLYRSRLRVKPQSTIRKVIWDVALRSIRGDS